MRAHPRNCAFGDIILNRGAAPCAPRRQSPANRPPTPPLRSGLSGGKRGYAAVPHPPPEPPGRAGRKVGGGYAPPFTALASPSACAILRYTNPKFL